MLSGLDEIQCAVIGLLDLRVETHKADLFERGGVLR